MRYLRLWLEVGVSSENASMSSPVVGEGSSFVLFPQIVSVSAFLKVTRFRLKLPVRSRDCDVRSSDRDLERDALLAFDPRKAM